MARRWALTLGAAIGLISAGACSKSGSEPGASQAGSGSQQPSAPGTPSTPGTTGPGTPSTPGTPEPGSPGASGTPSAPGAPPAPGTPPAPGGPADTPSTPGTPPAPSAPASSGEPRALSDDEIRTLVTPQLRAGEKLAHKPFRAPLGPSPDAVLAVVNRDGTAGGFVLVPGASPGGKPERKDLPPLSQGLLERVPAILFTDADGKPGTEAIIMTLQMTGAGPQGAIPRAFNQVIAWSGSAFVRLSDVEEDLLDLGTAAEIRKALRVRAARSKPK